VANGLSDEAEKTQKGWHQILKKKPLEDPETLELVQSHDTKK
jgi:hypothetical protein